MRLNDEPAHLRAIRGTLATRPHDPDLWMALAQALFELNQIAAAEAALRQAWALRPTEAARLNAISVVLNQQDRCHEALALLDLAAGLQPHDAATQLHRAEVLLRLGRLDEGFALYDWRFRTAGTTHVADSGFGRRTPWRGEALGGRTIMLVQEQGMGDTIQFVRYAPMVAARGGRVILGVDAGLAKLCAGLPGISQIISSGDVLPKIDIHCHLMSLPHAFGTTLDTVPADIPYLYAAPDDAAVWAARLGTGGGLRVGIAWAGNPAHLADRQRSIPFHALAPLWDVPGVRWFSLQVGREAALPSNLTNLAPWLSDYSQTAAAIAALDLVIAADTSVAHLAGALGKPVWLLLPKPADWRWLRTGQTTVWYPTMRLFRQAVSRDWDSVITAVAAGLHSPRGATPV